MKHNIYNKVPSSCAIFIDSCILYYVHMPLFIEGSKNVDKQNCYSKAIGMLLKNKKTLVTTWLNILEVFNIIERTAFEEYKKLNNLENKLTKKEYRKISEQRLIVQREIMRIYNEIQLYYKIIDVNVIEKYTKDFSTLYLNHIYDPTDFIITNIIIKEGICEIITDDQDFFQDTVFEVYTY